MKKFQPKRLLKMKDKNRMLSKSWVIGISLISLLLTSCLATKKYTSPELTSIHMFRLDSLSGDTTNINQLEWKQFFSDQILISYIDSALKNNYNNQIAFESIIQARAGFKKGKAGFLPSLDIKGETSRRETENNTSKSFELSGMLSWELDLWGKIGSQYKSSKADYLKSITAQKVIQTQLIADLASTYYQLLEAVERKEILLQNIQVREESLQTIKSLKEAGMQNQLAVNQSKAQLDLTRTMLTKAEYQVFTLENSLSILLGKPIKDLKRNSFDDQITPLQINGNLPASVLANRPDVKEAELEFRSYFEKFNVAKASMYPSIQLTAMAGYQNGKIDNWLDPDAFFTNLVGNLTQPLFRKRSLRTQKEIAESQMKQSLYRFQQKVLESGVEVSNALRKYNTQSVQLEDYLNQEEHLNLALGNARELLKNGFANYLEVLNVQENLLNVKLQRVSAQSQKLQSEVMVYKALGGGVK
jgi:NodT family efflux transporter outer membrane factor (OMF) lipoprotein